MVTHGYTPASMLISDEANQKVLCDEQIIRFDTLRPIDDQMEKIKQNGSTSLAQVF